jgi:hypothetical protein
MQIIIIRVLAKLMYSLLVVNLLKYVIDIKKIFSSVQNLSVQSLLKKNVAVLFCYANKFDLRFSVKLKNCIIYCITDK